jgi:hypothetical protein
MLSLGPLNQTRIHDAGDYIAEAGVLQVWCGESLLSCNSDDRRFRLRWSLAAHAATESAAALCGSRA